MKKIGIMTMARIKNYGSFLQAFALSRTVAENNKDCTVEFVDFKNSINVYKSNKSSFLGRVKLKILGFLGGLPVFNKIPYFRSTYNYNRFNKAMVKRFDKEFYKTLGVNPTPRFCKDLDLLIIGSDEVFNYVQNSTYGYGDELFGASCDAKKIISFAGSFGYTTLEKLEDNGYTEKIRKYLNGFTAISVRDMNSFNIVKELTGKSPEYNLDPVFHYDYSGYIPKIKKEKYIAVYAYSGLEDSVKKEITAFAKKHGLKIFCIQGYQQDFGKFLNINPFEVLGYIQNAEYVFTNTFHGSVFSIKYNKRFCVLLTNEKNYSNVNKTKDVLEFFNLTDRIIDNVKDVGLRLEDEIDYVSVNEKIQTSVNKGKEYLFSNVKKL